MAEILALGLAVPEDAGQIASMSRDLIESGLCWSWTPPRVKRHIQDRDCSVVVARAAHRLAGFAIMRFAQESAHLNLLAVQPEWQRQGCGRRLIEWLLASADVAGIRCVNLELRSGNAVARRFYDRLGFQVAGERPRYYEGVESATTMSLNLNETSFSRHVSRSRDLHS